MICPDCKIDGKTINTVFDFKQMGETCPKCERVYSPNVGLSHKHYASEKAAKVRMARDRQEEKAMINSTRAMVDRILRPID